MVRLCPRSLFASSGSFRPSLTMTEVSCNLLLRVFGHPNPVISTGNEGALRTEAEWRDPEDVPLPCRVKAFSRFFYFICIVPGTRFLKRRRRDQKLAQGKPWGQE